MSRTRTTSPELMYIYLDVRRVILLTTCLFMLILTASAIAQTATPSPTPHKAPEIFYSEVLQRLRFVAGKRRSDAEISAEIVTELKCRKVYIVLTDAYRKELKEAGASDELIHYIDTALTDAEKKKVAADLKKVDEMNRLYQIVLDNYKSNDREKFILAVNAAKEFIKRFGNVEIAQQNVGWLKSQLARWENKLIILSH